MFGNMQKWQKQIEGLLNNGGEERPYKVDVAPKMVNWHNSRLSALGGTWRRRAAGARVPSRKQKTPSIVDFTPLKLTVCVDTFTSLPNRSISLLSYECSLTGWYLTFY